MTAFPTKAQIKRAIAAAREAGAFRVRLPGEIEIDVQPARLDAEEPEDFSFDHEDHHEPA